MMWRSVLISLIYMTYMSTFPNTTCWRDGLLYIVHSCLLCCRLIDHSYVGLFLSSLFCCIDLYFCFCAYTMLFWLLYLCSIVWSLEDLWLQLCLFFLVIVLAILGLLWFHINFRMISSRYVENVMGILIRITLDL